MRTVNSKISPAVRLIVLGLLTAGGAAAQVEVPAPLTPFAARPGAAALDHAGLRMTLDPTLYGVLKGEASVTLTGFPIGAGEGADLVLESFGVLTPDARLVVQDGAVQTDTPAPDMVLLRGVVAGVSDSQVFLAFSPHGSNGFVRMPGRTVLVAAGDTPGEVFVYDAAELERFVSIGAQACGGALDPVAGRPRAFDRLLRAADPVAGAPAGGDAGDATAGAGAGALESATCRTIRVAIDTDWEYRQIPAFASTAAAQTYALTLYAAIGEIFRRDTGVSLTVPFVRVWSSNTDPYADGSDVIDRLFEFRDHWNASQTGVSRDIANILTGIRFGGAGGVAYLSALCNPQFGYGANGYLNGSFPVPVRDRNAQNWDLFVTAHELGHNFGAPHTHDMSPPVDECGLSDCSDAANGTIMSYCHGCPGGLTNITLTLQQRVIDEHILPFIDGTVPGCGPRFNVAAITTPPVNLVGRVGGSVTLNASVTGGGTLATSWRFLGLPLNNGISPRGSVVSGATTPNLTISNLKRLDSGPYTLSVSNACSSATATATLSVFCTADANLDGNVELDDFFHFFNCFDATDACADLDGTTGVDLGDFFAFLNAFDAGC